MSKLDNNIIEILIYEKFAIKPRDKNYIITYCNQSSYTKEEFVELVSKLGTSFFEYFNKVEQIREEDNEICIHLSQKGLEKIKELKK